MLNKNIDIQDLLVTVIFTILGVFIPMIFHLLGLGAVFLPMFLPLAAGAFLVKQGNALLMGAVTPIVSAILTGMPPFYPPVAPAMVFELALFCLIISILQHRTKLPLMIILLAAVVTDRVLVVILYMVLLPLFHVSFKAFTLYESVKSLPGIILMLIVVPILVPLSQRILENARPRIYELSSEDEE